MDPSSSPSRSPVRNGPTRAASPESPAMRMAVRALMWSACGPSRYFGKLKTISSKGSAMSMV
jgi:hypothetical protein